RVKELEALGGEVLALAADVADPEAMGRAVAVARQRFGAIHGVIHAAGTVDPSTFVPVQQLGPALCEVHFRPKIQGLLVLEEALAGEDLDFVFLFSSLSSVLGGIGFAAYTAANLFLDGFARDQDRKAGRTRWISVGWDTWRVGKDLRGAGLESTIAEFAMTPQEGLEAFRRVLAAEAGPLWTHSTGDLQARIDQWLLRTALRSPEKKAGGSLYSRPSLQTAYVPVSSDTERTIARVWQEILGIDRVGVHDNYFDLGGTSLNAIQVVAELQKELDVEIHPVALFEAPTVAELAKRLRPQEGPDPGETLRAAVARRQQSSQAREGSEIAIVGMAGRFPGARDVDELWSNLCAGVESLTFFTDEELRRSGVPPERIADPNFVKARPILDSVDLFDAAFFGYSPREASLMDPQHRVFLEIAWEALESAGYTGPYGGAVGVFAGSNISTYLMTLLADEELVASVSDLEGAITNDRDSLATSVSYKLNLKGPSLTVQTFCSTSAVAVHMACQSLLVGDCDVALAGGVSVRVPQKSGYLHQPGGQDSPDGHTRTFDERARGTVFGDGAGAVVLKRLADALADGDCVHAVIRGTAINNDGSLKVGYTAPSVEGQAEVVAVALAKAGVPAETIHYVEAHGTATELGDPIEVSALTKAYRLHTAERQYCALGSVKTNLGHLDRAAGVTALIKTVMALEHGRIPPSLHFERPNPKIDFESSPFYVNTALSEWKANGAPRRAGVNSLGVGGTNVHLVLEEAPVQRPGSPSRAWQLLVLSARSAPALEQAAANLADFLRRKPEASLADVAYTLQVGKRTFDHRRFLVCRNREEAIELLDRHPASEPAAGSEPGQRQVVFFLSAAGLDGTRELYRDEAVFRQALDQGARLVQAQTGEDLLKALYPPLGVMETREVVERAVLAYPAQVAVSHALGRLWMEMGVRPEALAGSGPGELAAACLAGALSLEDAVRLAIEAGRLADEQAPPDLATERLAALGSRLRPQPPRIPILSGLTGAWVTPDQAANPAHWISALTPARSVEEMSAVLLEEKHRVLLEIGASLDQPQILRALGELWSAGVGIDWMSFYRPERRHRIPLPTYPFQRQRFWIDPRKPEGAVRSLDDLDKTPDVGDWFYRSVWKESPARAVREEPSSCWLALAEKTELDTALADRLRDLGQEVVRVHAGAAFERQGDVYLVDPGRPQDYELLVEDLRARGKSPNRVVHLWSLSGPPEEGEPSTSHAVEHVLASGFFPLLYLVQSLGRRRPEGLEINVISNGLEERPEQALLTGPCLVVPQEYSGIACRSIDLALDEPKDRALAGRLVDELLTRPADSPEIAFRAGRRWVRDHV
ncbi:MAG TPA: SDR family NAD(P)-dependent oxidoreductase, partial [Thermoanaerobaculia bacterium]|nr:SDR family NAD(P)-dependent oxidoreductase [Thermoanaerobaculia bacterium]